MTGGGRSPGVALACLLAGGALLGVSTNLAALAGRAGVAPLPFLAWSCLGAAAALLAAAMARGAPPPLTRRAAEYFLVAGVVSLAAPNLLFFAAAPRIGAGFVALAIAFSPLVTYAGAVALRFERFDAGRFLGVALALGGAAALAAPKLRAEPASAGWVLAALSGPLLLAAGNLYRSRRWPPGARPEALAPGMLGGAALALFAGGLAAGSPLGVPATAAALGVTTAQTACFAGYYALFFVLQKHGGPVMMSFLGSVGAVVGVPVAVGLLGEPPPAGLALGAGLVAAGLALFSQGAARAARQAAAAGR